VLVLTEFYPLQPFRIRKREALLQIINNYPLATLISGNQSADEISLIPLIVDVRSDEQMILTGHVDRNNPQAAKLIPGESVAFIFNGPDAYASPDIYDDAQLPGWLYVMVKGTGLISRSIESAEMVEMLCRSSSRFGGEGQDFLLQKHDPRFDLFIGGIVGFEIEVANITGIAKLAQDKGPEHSQVACNFLADADNAEIPAFLRQMLDGTT